jgi:hypothetical protein
VGVVIEAAGILSRGVERIFACMAERRVAEIVRKAERLGQILIKTERARHRPSDLRNLDAVGQADAVVVTVGGDEHLSLVTEPAESDRMDQPVSIALEDVARPARS